jgi:hypothetical protein
MRDETGLPIKGYLEQLDDMMKRIATPETDEEEENPRGLRVNPPSKSPTPWGRADDVTTLGKGLHWFMTPGHGGLRVNLSIHPLAAEILAEGIVWARSNVAWFEEDNAWAHAVVASPVIAEAVGKGWGKSTEEITREAMQNIQQVQKWRRERVNPPQSETGLFWHFSLADPALFDPKSFRVVDSDGKGRLKLVTGRRIGKSATSIQKIMVSKAAEPDKARARGHAKDYLERRQTER